MLNLTRIIGNRLVGRWRVIVFGIVFFTIFYHFHGYSVDLEGSFLPAAGLMLSGKSPYISSFYNPPWLMLPVMPFTLLPLRVARSVFATVTVLAYFYIARRLGASVIGAVAFVISPPVVVSVLYGSLDWLILLGLTLPPSLGILLLIAKPQVGIGAVLYRLLEVKRWRGKLVILLPTAVLTLLSLFVYGFWPINLVRAVTDSTVVGFNMAAWWAVPIGIYLLARGIREKNVLLAAAAGPFFSPHVVVYSWCVIYLPIIKDTKLAVIASLLFWLLTLVRLMI